MKTAFVVFGRDAAPYMVVETSTDGTRFKPMNDAAKNLAKAFSDEYASSEITRAELSAALDAGMQVEGPMPPAAVAAKLRSQRTPAKEKNLPVVPMSDVPIGHFSNIEFKDVIAYKASAFVVDRYKTTFNYEVKRVRAVWDPSLSIPGTGRRGGWRCPTGTRFGGQITDRFGRNCGWGIARRIANQITNIGERLENIDDRRRGRRVDRRNRRMLERLQREQDGGRLERGLRGIAERLEGGDSPTPSPRGESVAPSMPTPEAPAAPKPSTAKKPAKAPRRPQGEMSRRRPRPAPAPEQQPEAPARPRKPRTPTPVPSARNADDGMPGESPQVPESAPDSRSFRNIRNRFGSNGLPNDAYWRAPDYDGSDKDELERRFGRYYSKRTNRINARGREAREEVRRGAGQPRGRRPRNGRQPAAPRDATPDAPAPRDATPAAPAPRDVTPDAPAASRRRPNPLLGEADDDVASPDTPRAPRDGGWEPLNLGSNWRFSSTSGAYERDGYRLYLERDGEGNVVRGQLHPPEGGERLSIREQEFGAEQNEAMYERFAEGLYQAARSDLFARRDSTPVQQRPDSTEIQNRRVLREGQRAEVPDDEFLPMDEFVRPFSEENGIVDAERQFVAHELGRRRDENVDSGQAHNIWERRVDQAFQNMYGMDRQQHADQMAERVREIPDRTLLDQMAALRQQIADIQGEERQHAEALRRDLAQGTFSEIQQTANRLANAQAQIEFLREGLNARANEVARRRREERGLNDGARAPMRRRTDASAQQASRAATRRPTAADVPDGGPQPAQPARTVQRAVAGAPERAEGAQERNAQYGQGIGQIAQRGLPMDDQRVGGPANQRWNEALERAIGYRANELGRRIGEAAQREIDRDGDRRFREKYAEIDALDDAALDVAFRRHGEEAARIESRINDKRRALKRKVDTYRGEPNNPRHAADIARLEADLRMEARNLARNRVEGEAFEMVRNARLARIQQERAERAQGSVAGLPDLQPALVAVVEDEIRRGVKSQQRRVAGYLVERHGDGDLPWTGMTPERFRQMSPEEKKAYLKNIYSHDIIRGQNGKFYRVAVTSVSGVGATFEVRGRVQEVDANGRVLRQQVGTFSRTVHVNGEYVYNNSFFIEDPQDKRNGVATIFNNYAWMGLQAIGIKEAKVTAAADGPYVWAKMGYVNGDIKATRKHRRGPNGEYLRDANGDYIIDNGRESLQRAIDDYRAGRPGVVKTEQQARLLQALLDAKETGPNGQERERVLTHQEMIFGLLYGMTPAEKADREKEVRDWVVGNVPFPGGALNFEKNMIVPDARAVFLQESKVPTPRTPNAPNAPEAPAAVPNAPEAPAVAPPAAAAPRVGNVIGDNQLQLNGDDAALLMRMGQMQIAENAYQERLAELDANQARIGADLDRVRDIDGDQLYASNLRVFAEEFDARDPMLRQAEADLRDQVARIAARARLGEQLTPEDQDVLRQYGIARAQRLHNDRLLRNMDARQAELRAEQRQGAAPAPIAEQRRGTAPAPIDFLPLPNVAENDPDGNVGRAVDLIGADNYDFEVEREIDRAIREGRVVSLEEARNRAADVSDQRLLDRYNFGRSEVARLRRREAVAARRYLDDDNDSSRQEFINVAAERIYYERLAGVYLDEILRRNAERGGSDNRRPTPRATRSPGQAGRPRGPEAGRSERPAGAPDGEVPAADAVRAILNRLGVDRDILRDYGFDLDREMQDRLGDLPSARLNNIPDDALDQRIAMYEEQIVLDETELQSMAEQVNEILFVMEQAGDRWNADNLPPQTREVLGNFQRLVSRAARNQERLRQVRLEKRNRAQGNAGVPAGNAPAAPRMMRDLRSVNEFRQAPGARFTNDPDKLPDWWRENPRNQPNFRDAQNLLIHERMNAVIAQHADGDWQVYIGGDQIGLPQRQLIDAIRNLDQEEQQMRRDGRLPRGQGWTRPQRRPAGQQPNVGTRDRELAVDNAAREALERNGLWAQVEQAIARANVQLDQDIADKQAELLRARQAGGADPTAFRDQMAEDIAREKMNLDIAVAAERNARNRINAIGNRGGVGRANDNFEMTNYGNAVAIRKYRERRLADLQEAERLGPIIPPRPAGAAAPAAPAPRASGNQPGPEDVVDAMLPGMLNNARWPAGNRDRVLGPAARRGIDRALGYRVGQLDDNIVEAVRREIAQNGAGQYRRNRERAREALAQGATAYEALDEGLRADLRRIDGDIVEARKALARRAKAFDRNPNNQRAANDIATQEANLRRLARERAMKEVALRAIEDEGSEALRQTPPSGSGGTTPRRQPNVRRRGQPRVVGDGEVGPAGMAAIPFPRRENRAGNLNIDRAGVGLGEYRPVVNSKITDEASAIQWVADGGDMSQVPHEYWAAAIFANSSNDVTDRTKRFRRLAQNGGAIGDTNLFAVRGADGKATKQGWVLKAASGNDNVGELVGWNLQAAAGLNGGGAVIDGTNANGREFVIIPFATNDIPDEAKIDQPRGGDNFHRGRLDQHPEAYAGRLMNLAVNALLGVSDRHAQNGFGNIAEMPNGDEIPVVQAWDLGWALRATYPNIKDYARGAFWMDRGLISKIKADITGQDVGAVRANRLTSDVRRQIQESTVAALRDMAARTQRVLAGGRDEFIRQALMNSRAQGASRQRMMEQAGRIYDHMSQVVGSIDDLATEIENMVVG